ncbi:class I SAM-dependent methyltransferase [Saccharibacillus sp. JS10]|uniref:class I SAM-dependent methyltransferase n=1 Tax=Saccharibacillus sp. JS10 TaxID=2950552 RepID=UPI00210E1D7B|nr:class I SAM-dependent methyltransferase [Saccharibacillus sp. JS10]MCQ4088471.1 methyltransferase domain-containing protein [Saccharibacillus sp. JS10]
MSEQIRSNNVERFTGFGSLYDHSRPAAPPEVIQILEMYLQRSPEHIADVGCGTGLSTFLWLDIAKQIIGIEPSQDMRQVAEDKRQALGYPAHLTFREGYSDALGLPNEWADLITCSQSFHWMNPQPTLTEFARVLRPGGIFAAYDCDWPPVINLELEEGYKELSALAERRVAELSEAADQAYKWNKHHHLQQMIDSGHFRYVKEIVFHHWETFDAARYVNLALSQGATQGAIKLGAEDVLLAAEQFRSHTEAFFAGNSKDILFSYRMRLAMK